jgi:exo-beta-1,3-glucanase (GH17 family)
VPKRAITTITDLTYSTSTEVPEIVVYVDQYGNSVSTATETVVIIPGATSSSSSLSTSSTDTPAPPITHAAPPAVLISAPPVPVPVPVPSPSSLSSLVRTTSSYAPSPTSTQGSSSQGGNLHGVAYSPYKANGACKTADEVTADFALFAKDFGIVRLYGVDCDQVATVYAAAKQYGNKLMLGIFDIDHVPAAVSAMVAGVNNDWSIVDTVSVGNELVNGGSKSVTQVVASMTQARNALRAAGYNGPVVAVDTYIAVENNPDLCNESDYCAVNVHPFFDSNTAASSAGAFVTSAVASVRSKLSDPSKRVVVTETGWPWQGNANGAAVPSLDNQAAAVSSIKSAFSSNPADCILFTAFNDMWKKPADPTFNAEQFWGMGGASSPSDN